MKILLSQLVNSQEALNKLLVEKLPVKVSYRISKNFRTIEPELKQYETTRQKLITETYGSKNENGDWKVEADKMNGFIKELSELLSVELDLDVLKFELPDTCQISAGDVYLLDYMIDMKEEKSNVEA